MSGTQRQDLESRLAVWNAALSREGRSDELVRQCELEMNRRDRQWRRSFARRMIDCLAIAPLKAALGPENMDGLRRAVGRTQK